jgi:hypothetical protein
MMSFILIIVWNRFSYEAVLPFDLSNSYADFGIGWKLQTLGED